MSEKKFETVSPAKWVVQKGHKSNWITLDSTVAYTEKKAITKYNKLLCATRYPKNKYRDLHQRGLARCVRLAVLRPVEES